MSEVRRWYIGVYGGEAQARGCTPHTREIIRDSEREIFVLDADFERVDAERNALQALLTAADERADVLERALNRIIYRCGVFIDDDASMSADSLEALIGIARAALKPAEGNNCDHLYIHFGTEQPRRRCNNCNKLEPVEGGGDA